MYPKPTLNPPSGLGLANAGVVVNLEFVVLVKVARGRDELHTSFRPVVVVLPKLDAV
jgi:hypothetical protein